MRHQDLAIVRSLPYFTSYTDQQLDALTRGGLIQRYSRDTVLFEQGERPEFLYVLTKGSVLLSGSTEPKREAVIEVLTPMDIFVLAAVLTDTPYLMSAKLLEPSCLLLIPARNLREQITKEPLLAVTMLESLSVQCRRMVRQVKDLKLRTSKQRLAAYLLTLAAPMVDGTTVELPMPKSLLASRLGMTPENLSRALASLSEQQVRVDGRAVTIGSIERLRDYCLPDALIDEIERAPLTGCPPDELPTS
ncbi:cyclic nucleotide-binding domain-containing protein [Azospirillum sp.]|uniref:cyclic nucleotide-binding domain-containing protein n=1 Tax=Azospirillum sp. TaxID=34012 RepID=UPI003D73B75D